MYYTYILLSDRNHTFYFGSANDLRGRLVEHNKGKIFSTKPYVPWRLVWYGAFTSEKEARRFEKYLKSGSGRSFAYKRLISVALAKNFSAGRKGSPKRKAKDT